ncbi:dnaJ homolog subfamily C member 11-like [Xenia sp. Carnegie-2017]|uniref:dnaJ homolog subfamily C member 11-like n=1 Tax=Xenia sp. Carnegie-2017 TaxID=2897299 RepID=UPI001F046AB3|nr:dnaJ homolog subfamily C member 11-like [Xenia sp. Carnegie-2017]
MASEEESENFVEINYYIVLNVSKEASTEEIKSSYRRLCKLYHPDRHVEQTRKEQAVKFFNQLQKAYEVLSNEEKRAIYDMYGQKGLDADWQVIARQRTPAEIQEEYERLQRQKEEEMLNRRTNPKGSFIIGIDGTDIFEHYEDYNDEFRLLPNIEVTKMNINQSIEAPLTSKDTITLGGNLAVQNGNGTGHVSAAWRRVISTFSWAEAEFAAGNGPLFQMRIFKNISKSSYGSACVALHGQNKGFGAGIQAMVARQLGNQTTGYMTWKAGSGSSLETSLVKESANSRLQLGLQLGIKNCFASFSYNYKIAVDTTVRTGIKLGFLGSNVSYGADHKISERSNIGMSVNVSTLSGVTLKIRLNRSNQSFVFPFYLSESISPMAIFYGTVTPLILYYSINTLIVKPFLAQAKQRESKEKQDKFAEKLSTMKKNAEDYTELMRETYESCVECERKRHGLIIVSAFYGKFLSFSENDLNNPYRMNKIIDVTLVLQCLVKDSKLYLPEGSKTQISGFYDPCFGEDKSLQVRYLFRDILHEAIIDDCQQLRIPIKSHRLQSTDST